MICTLCFRAFDPCDSLGSLDGLCQDCWESACSDEWWDAMAALTTFEQPLESFDGNPEPRDHHESLLHPFRPR